MFLGTLCCRYNSLSYGRLFNSFNRVLKNFNEVWKSHKKNRMNPEKSASLYHKSYRESYTNLVEFQINIEE